MQNGNAYLGMLRGPWIESGGFLEFDFGGEKGSDEWPFGSAQGKPFEAQGKRVAGKRFEERSRSLAALGMTRQGGGGNTHLGGGGGREPGPRVRNYQGAARASQAAPRHP